MTTPTKDPTPCFLCGRPATTTRLFVPYQDREDDLVAATAREHGLPPPGKVRRVLYGLCGTCELVRGPAQCVAAVERKLFAAVDG
jgi:hypothetical protein